MTHPPEPPHAAASGASRRDWIQAAMVWVSLGSAGLVVCRNVLRYLIPPLRRARFRKLFVARRADLNPDEIREILDLRGRPVAILEGASQAPLAVSLVCTHLGCRVHWQPKQRTFLCPCHMGIFDEQGRVLSGPPPAPLERHEVSVEAENVFVNLPEV